MIESSKNNENIIKANKNFKNKDAVEIKLVNAGGEEIDIIRIDRPDMTEENIEKREKIIDMIVSTSEEEVKKIPSELHNLLENLKKIDKKTFKDYVSKNKIVDLFNDQLGLKLEDLNEKELDFVMKILNINKSDVKMKEYNEFGLPIDIDPEILEYISVDPFNPETDEFIPPLIENLDCNREHIDIDRSELNDDYKEVFDKLQKEYDIKESNEKDDDDFLPDDFVLIANGGTLPILVNDDAELLISNQLGDNNKVKNSEFNEENLYELEEEEICTKKQCNNNKKQESKLQNNLSKEKYVPSYKFITPEESEYLKKINENYKDVRKEYDDLQDNEIKEISKENKAKLKEAIKEMDELYSNSKFPNKLKKQEVDDEIFDDEEEFEEYEDLEDLENEIYNETKNVENQEEVELLSKDNIKKLLEFYNPMYKNEEKQVKEDKDDNNKDNKYEKVKHKDNISWEEIDKITLNQEALEKTMILLNQMFEKEEKENNELLNKENNSSKKKRVVKYLNKETNDNEYYIVHTPKVYENIINTMEEDKSEIKPKKIGIKSEKLTKEEVTLMNISKINNNPHIEDKSVVTFSKIKDLEDVDKKDRKKQVKLENKERRQKKKILKEAFKKEKLKVTKVISDANKVIRNGLSVKEI